MGRVIGMTVKFVIGAAIGAVIGAAATAYIAGADPAGTSEGIIESIKGRLSAARAAGDAAAMQTEAVLTQQFRTKVRDPSALNPPA